MKQIASPRWQGGLSIVCVLLLGVVVVFLVITGAKLMPAITEYLAIGEAVRKIKYEGNTVGDIRRAFDRHAAIDNIRSISSKDLEITKDGDRIVISYSYPYQIKLFDNVRVVIDFAGSTGDGPGTQGR